MHSLERISCSFIYSGIDKQTNKPNSQINAAPVGKETERAIVLELIENNLEINELPEFNKLKRIFDVSTWDDLSISDRESYRRDVGGIWRQCDIKLSNGIKRIFGEIKTTTSIYPNFFKLINNHVTSIRVCQVPHLSIIHYPDENPKNTLTKWNLIIDRLEARGHLSKPEKHSLTEHFFILSTVPNPIKYKFKRLPATTRNNIYYDLEHTGGDPDKIFLCLKSNELLTDSDLNFLEWNRLITTIKTYFG